MLLLQSFQAAWDDLEAPFNAPLKLHRARQAVIEITVEKEVDYRSLGSTPCNARNGDMPVGLCTVLL